MYGWRGRLGLIVPADNTVIEPEFLKVIPEGVSIHGARLSVWTQEVAELSKATDQATQVAEGFIGCMDAIAYCCLASSVLKGPEWAENLRRRLEEKTKTKVTSAAMATLEAIRKYNLKRIAIATPYSDEKNKLVSEFMKSGGIEVTDIKGVRPVPKLQDINNFQPTVAYRLARSLNHEGADGVLISSTNFRSMEIISSLEQDLEKTVISTNQAIAWKLLTMIGIRPTLKGFGALLGDELMRK